MATPPNFTAGQILTAAQMDEIGLWTVIPQTSFTSVSAITHDDIFTTDFTNYWLRMFYSTSTTLTVRFQVRSGGAARTTLYYGGGLGSEFAANVTQYYPRSNNGTVFTLSNNVNSGSNYLDLEILSPLATRKTALFGNFISDDNIIAYHFGGFHSDAVSNDGFTITTSTGNITGNYVLYGYNIL